MTKLDLNTRVIRKPDELGELKLFLDSTPIFGLDIETTVTNKVFDRHIRTIQIGNREIQFVIDLKHFSNGDILNQGFCKTPDWALPLKELFDPYFLSNKSLKVGHNLSFEYETFLWCLGIKFYGLYDTYISELVLNAGKVKFTTKDFFGLEDVAKRRCNFEMSKELQLSFNTEDELTEDQIYYAALDTRVPLAVRLSQLKEIERYELQNVVRIENDAVPYFSDLHVNGFYLDKNKWIEVIKFYQNKHVHNIEQLDKFFIPVVGRRLSENQIKEIESLVLEAEQAWRNETKDRELRAQLRKRYQELNRELKTYIKESEGFEGQAYINYGSPEQMLNALRKAGIRLPDTNDNTLNLIDKPIIKAVQNYRETLKVLSTYGENWFEYINEKTGLVHSRFWQIGSETGRTSSTGPNCFPKEVELLTKDGWKNFDKVTLNDLIAEFDIETEKIYFNKPLSVIKSKTDRLIEIKTPIRKGYINFISTPNHRVFLKSRKTNKLKYFEVDEYPKEYLQTHAGNYVGGDLSYTEDQLIIIAALQADGNINASGALRFGFKRERKISRFLTSIKNLGIKIKENKSSKPGYRYFYISRKNIPDWLVNKKYFDNWILDLDFKSFNFLANEVWFWDGSHKYRSKYSSVIKKNADLVQILCTLTGKRTTLTADSSSNRKNVRYIVNSSDTKYSQTSNHRKLIIEANADVYCVTMPRNTIVIRYNGRTAIVNNCQNIRSAEGLDLDHHHCFTARSKDRTLVIVDMSGAELRLIAEMSGERLWVDAFAKGWDVHSMGAELIFPKEWEEGTEPGCKYVEKKAKCSCAVHKKLRGWVKSINFGIAYGMAARRLSQELGISEEKAQELLDSWCLTFKEIIAYLTKSGINAKTELMSKSLIGRIRWFNKPDVDVARNRLLKDQLKYEKKGKTFNVTSQRVRSKLVGMYAAIDREGKNSPIQSGNADIAKLAAGCGYDKNGKPFLWHLLQQYDALNVNFVHDEFVIDCPIEHAEKVKEIVVDAIRRAGAEYMSKVVMEAEGVVSFIWKK